MDSLVTPSKTFLELLGTPAAIMAISRGDLIFKPAVPKKDDVYVIASVYIQRHGKLCVGLRDLECTDSSGAIVDLDIDLFNELQPPKERVVEGELIMLL